MVGFPMLSGFISKLLFATSALQSPHKMLLTMIGLAVSTILNAVYFLRLVITLYSRPRPAEGESTATGAAMPAAHTGTTAADANTAAAGAAEETTGTAGRPWSDHRMLGAAIGCFILLNLFLGLQSQPVVKAIGDGLAMFD